MISPSISFNLGAQAVIGSFFSNNQWILNCVIFIRPFTASYLTLLGITFEVSDRLSRSKLQDRTVAIKVTRTY
jgi:hypothetical protein